jgi:hypothetical protein
MGARWTDVERLVVCEIWKTPVRVEDQLHLLPGRTVDAVYREAEKLKIGRKALPVRDPIAVLDCDKAVLRTILNAEKGMSIDEIHRGSDVGKHRLRDALREMLAAEEIHISEYAGGYRTAHYKLGKGTNAVKPGGMTSKERRKRFEAKQRQIRKVTETDEQKAARLDAKYRARECAWWPQADAIVGNAMRAMVQLGRAGL